jgi:hypothetical protein
LKRVLLDENLPHSRRHHLLPHKVMTAADAGFAGLKNGQLLMAAETARFDVLITGDRTLHYEQNLSGRQIAIVSLSAVSWPIMEPYIHKIVAAVDETATGSFIYVECGKFRRVHKPSGPYPG